MGVLWVLEGVVGGWWVRHRFYEFIINANWDCGSLYKCNESLYRYNEFGKVYKYLNVGKQFKEIGFRGDGEAENSDNHPL